MEKAPGILLLLLWMLLQPFSGAFSQTYLFFQDSEDPEFYDYSWMDVTAPSTLERLGSDLRKFPVESNIPAKQGLNSLRLHWQSAEGGSWAAIAAGNGWAAKNLTGTDTLLFFIYPTENIDSNALPLVFMEDTDNRKSSFHSIAPYAQTLTPQAWHRIAIPMQLFFGAGDAVMFNSIKTIGFTQGAADGQSHTLLVDDMRVFKGQGVAPPVQVPQNVVALGYDSHIEITWDANPPSNLNGYQVERSDDDGQTFTTIATVVPSDSGAIDWVRQHGYGKTFLYRIAALNASNQLSEYSDTVTAATVEFTTEQMLDMVQRYTFRYFYDFAHPVSGLSRERNTSGNTVTTGGSGFGLMALLVGIERGFISRGQGLNRAIKVVDFLEKADRFHGVWPHWLNGVTGNVVPFSQYDNGGDLVETAFMAQGLLTLMEYFNGSGNEAELRNKIFKLYSEIEWSWYKRYAGSSVLYWHWSPNYTWQMNHQVRGWNEAAIVYLLAIASPSYPVDSSLWFNGWAGLASYRNGKSFYGYPLSVGWDYGGPLFFAHYSFMGYDPRKLNDGITNYFELNRNHTLIHRAYAIDNPKNYPNYGENEWGFTASDDPDGYAVHEPAGNRDNGTISPTAAISSMPYTPDESIAAMIHMYRERGHKIWGRMGFYDAYNVNRNWYADSYLAIDQGPIINMIENYRSGLLWNNFKTLGTYKPSVSESNLLIAPNPANNTVSVTLNNFRGKKCFIVISNSDGREVLKQYLTMQDVSNNKKIVTLNVSNLAKGLYLINVYEGNANIHSGKLIIN